MGNLTKKVFYFFLSVYLGLLFITFLLKKFNNYYSYNQDLQIHLFPALSSLEYDHPKYNFTANINSFGFRGDEPELSKPKKIIILGDSITYGWGVKNSLTWPYLLEDIINNKNYNKWQVYNLSSPSNNPTDYYHTAEKYIPVLKPDIVLVAVTDDDISQITNNEYFNISKKTIDKKGFSNAIEQKNSILFLPDRIISFFTDTINNEYPSLSKKLNEGSDRKVNLQYRWQKQADFLLSNTPEDKIDNFLNLSLEIRNKFINGYINPAFLIYSIYKKDHFSLIDGSNNLKESRQNFHNVLKNISRLSEKYNSTVIIVEIPAMVYVSDKYLNQFAEIGLTFSKGTELGDMTIKILEDTAKDLKLPLINNLDTFRKRCSLDENCFFDYDGHTTGYGNRIIAEQVYHKMKDYLNN